MTGSASALARLGGLLAAGVVAAGVAGCTSSGSSSTAAGAGTTTSSAPTSPAAGASSSSVTSPPAGGSGSASASASSGSGGGGTTTDACTTDNLSVKAGNSEGAAGSVYTTLDFTNTGSTSCTLYGYPGVSLATGSPATQVGAAASRSSLNSPAVVTLKPGGVGNALLRITQAQNYPSASCSPADTTYLRVYPPGETKSVLVSYKSTGCSKTGVKLLSVGAVRAGATAQQ